MRQTYRADTLVIFLLITTVPLLAQPSAGRLKTQPQPYEKTFAAHQISSLTLDNTSLHGNIEVQAWDRQEIKITAEIHAPHTFIEPNLSKGALIIKLRRKGLVSTEPVHFRVWLPPTCEVNLSTMNGKIVVRGVRTKLKALTTDGDIELIDTGGTWIDATSSMSGNIKLSGQLNHEGKYHLYSAMGRIDISFRDPASFTFDAATRQGRIQTEGVHLNGAQRSDHHVTGDYGQGHAILLVRTVSGTIQLRKQP
ncbi:MAG: DUF4097 family beta strand repeat-containing protein [Acidobacteriota bacterium]|nr:DUF4097 family beta strand repeat-containing protein [Acidobacteriota bacterium]